MRQVALAVVAASVLLGLLLVPTARPYAADQGVAGYQKWEYKVIFGGINLSTAYKDLPPLGKDGWEVCGVAAGDRASAVGIILKRPMR